MAVRIVEDDFGTKGATIKKLKQLQREGPKRFEKMALMYWQRVYANAVRDCPVDTGALRASIRIKKGKSNMRSYEVARGSVEGVLEYYIIAGGGGVINPKHRREVHYALAVHDGVPVRRIPANPFLDRAIQKTEAYLWELMKKHANWYVKEWAKDQPAITMVPVPASKYFGGGA